MHIKFIYSYPTRISFLVCLVFILLLGNTSLFAQKKKKDQDEKPLAYYEKLVEDQEAAIKLHNQGFRHFARKEYSKALILFDQAIALDTVNAHYFSNRGHTHKALGNWEKALADYQKANQIDPEATHETYEQSAEIYREVLHNYEKAIEYYGLSIKRLKANKLLHVLYINYFNRANCYLKLKKHPQAIEDYTTTLELNKEHYGAYLNRGMARYQSQDKSGACADWQQAKKLGYTKAATYIHQYCK